MSNFDELMSKKTDAQLKVVVLSPEGDYQTAAVDAAKRELAKRGISTEQVEEARESVNRTKTVDAKKAAQPLELFLKIIVLVTSGTVGISIIFLIISGVYRTKGYAKKADDIIKFVALGIIFYVVIFVLAFLFNGSATYGYDSMQPQPMPEQTL